MADSQRGVLRSIARAGLTVGLVFMVGQALAGPMTTPATFDVSATGAATYTIPIVVPPGVMGMEPKLSLSYNSQAGDGLLGVGWSLSGLSTITRCPRTLAQDGVRGGVRFDANDRFCLDGQRLMAINGGTYGAANTEYRTERDSFSKIVSYGGTTGDPAYFMAWTKGGKIYEYGNTADSRIPAQFKTQAKAWAVNRITDSKNNFMTVTYGLDTVAGGGHGPAFPYDYYPTQIDYTGNAITGQATTASVQFQYDSRNRSQPTTWVFGSPSSIVKRLIGIVTLVGATQVKEYRVGYAPDCGLNEWGECKTRLTSVQECSPASPQCKPAIVPQWSPLLNATTVAPQPSTLFSSAPADFTADVDGDGRADFIFKGYDSLNVALSAGVADVPGVIQNWGTLFGVGKAFPSAGTNPVFLLDVNGDGRADAVGIAADGVYVALSTGTAFGPPTRWIADFGTANGWLDNDTYPRLLVDVNGDGLADVVGFKNDGVYVAINTGSGSFAPAVKWSSDFGIASAVPFPNNSVYPRMVLDIDGDGLADIVGFGAAGTYVALNTGSGFGPITSWVSGFGVNQGYPSQNATPRFLVDLNRDGLPDIMGFASDGAHVTMNQGNNYGNATIYPDPAHFIIMPDFGSATPTTANPGAYPSQSLTPRYVMDMNGDGYPDIVGFTSNGSVVVAFTYFSGLFLPPIQIATGFGTANGYTAANLRQLVDVDGDGIPDVVGTLPTGIGMSVALSSHMLPENVITQLPNGLGGTVSIAYAPLTTLACWCYQKGTGAVYPQVDLGAPINVVKSVTVTNGAGGPGPYSANGTSSYAYSYGSLRSDLQGRGLLGFGSFQVSRADAGKTSLTTFRQDWPYTGLPSQIQQQAVGGIGLNGLLGQVANNYACKDSLTGAACAVASGHTYFPYSSQSTESHWDINGAQDRKSVV
jgi:hypothetical protein